MAAIFIIVKNTTTKMQENQLSIYRKMNKIDCGIFIKGLSYINKNDWAILWQIVIS